MKEYYYGKGGENLDDDYEVIYPEGSDEGYEKYVPYYDELDGDFKYLPAEEDSYVPEPRPQPGAGDEILRLMLEKIDELNSKVEGKAQDDYRIDELEQQIRYLKEQLHSLKGKGDVKKKFDEFKKELIDERERREEDHKKKPPVEDNSQSGAELDAERIIREIEKLNFGTFDRDLENRLEALVDKRVADAVRAASAEIKDVIKEYFEQLREENGRLIEGALAREKDKALEGISQKLSEHQDGVAATLDEYRARLSDAILKLSELGEKLEPKGVIDRDSLYAETMLDALSDIKADLRSALKEGEDLKAALKEIEEKASQLLGSGEKFDEELQLAFSDFAKSLSEQREEGVSRIFDSVGSLSENLRTSFEELKRFISSEVESKFSQQNLEDFKKELSNSLSLELKAELELLRQDLSILFEQLGSKVASIEERLEPAAEGQSGIEQAARIEEKLDELRQGFEEKISAIEEKVENLGQSSDSALASAIGEKMEKWRREALERLGELKELEGKIAAAVERLRGGDALESKIEELKSLVEALRDSRSLDYDLSRIYEEIKKLGASKGIFGENFETVDANVAQVRQELAEISQEQDKKGE